MKRKEFKIENNIDNTFINEFLKFYNEKNSEIDGINLNINITDNNISGEIDQLFLGYLTLYLIDFEKEDVNIYFKLDKDEKRVRSLAQQIKNVITTAAIKSSRFNLSYETTDKESGEIIVKRINLDFEELQANKTFIPTIFIDRNRNLLSERYFEPSYRNSQLDLIKDLYRKKIKEELPNRIGLENFNETLLFELNLEQFNFFELTVFRLLVSDGLYSLLAGKGIDKKEKAKRLQKNLEKISSYKLFAKNLSSGIKELSKNIEEHSSTGIGFITARIYDAKRLSELKGESENEFIKNRNESVYISDKKGNNKYFLDINVGDLGNQTVKEKYILNLEDNSKKYKENLVIENIEKDIEVIKRMNYQDFFVVNPDIYFDLSHQQNKLISRFGLHHFTYLLKDSAKSYVKVSSQNEGMSVYNFENKENYNTKINFIKFGTNYNCIVPIEINITNESNNQNNSNYGLKEGQQVGTFKKLNSFKKIKNLKEFQENKNSNTLYKLDIDQTSMTTDKYENIFSIYDKVKSIPQNIRESILLIDGNRINLKNESNWLRLLTVINTFFKDIIVYNLPFAKTLEIINIRKGYNQGNINFWNKESSVLFYSTKERNENFRFGATLLTGSNINSFNRINSLIWQHHYSFGANDGINYTFDNTKDIPEFKEITSGNFFNNGILNYFELLINIPDHYGGEISLFEKSIQYSLNTPFSERLNSKTNNRGYKVENTHFRLGSKIHISDFYYAKRLFQNSFFTTPLAFKIANDIKEKLSKGKKYTIVGYETYSSFFISTIRNISKQINQDIDINHCIIDKDGDVSISPENLNENIFIVVPIASSFSTSIKIKNQLSGILERNNKNPNIIDPYYNLILVGHTKTQKGSNEIIPFQKLVNSSVSADGYYDFDNEILNEFYWKSINTKEKTIRVNIFKTGEESAIEQKYYIPVYTRWQISSKCENCFTDHNQDKYITDEKCLIETGSASITPRLIFGMPKAKVPKNKAKGLNLKSTLIYGNYSKGRNNYLYYTRTGTLAKNNENEIIKWLESIKEKILNKVDGKKIVIVTPSSGSKSSFIDLVNEILFEYTANCLVISLEEDYIENAETLYSDGLFKADYVIYVDDVLSTINSFLETNYIVKYIRNKKEKGKGIDFCISLLNRMSFDCEENLLLKLVPLKSKDFDINLKNVEERLFYFTRLNNPSIDEPNNVFPLDKEKDRYEQLALTSSLDSLRDKFKYKGYKLNKKDLNNFKAQKLDSNWEAKKLFQLVILDNLYSAFEFNSEQYKLDLASFFNIEEEDGFNYEKAFNNLKTFVLSPLEDDYHIDVISEIKKYYLNIDFTLLKIICSTPLVYYKAIRETAFNWILIKLEDERKFIDNTLLKSTDTEIESNDFELIFNYFRTGEYPRVKNLKFFLKRSVELKSNYIISNSFFESICKLINRLYLYNQEVSHNLNKGLSKIEEPDLFSPSTTFVPIEYIPTKELVYSLTGYIQELLFNHETKALKLESTINQLIETGTLDINSDLRNGNSNHYLRLLKLENTEAIDRFWHYYLEKEKNRDLNNNVLAENELSIDKILELNEGYKNDPKFKSIILLESNCQNSLIKFFKLKALLYNLSVPNAKTVINDSVLMKDKEKGIEKNIKRLLSGIKDIIIGKDSGTISVNQCLLSVNFNSIEKFTEDDLYTFKLKDEYTFTDAFSELQNSATMAMFKGIPAYKQNIESDSRNIIKLSNIEIRKDENGEILVRENTINPYSNICEKDKFSTQLGVIKDYSDVKDLKPNESLLLIGISSYHKKNSGKPSLVQQAILSIFLNTTERIEAEKLRLILLLRKSLSEYLNEHTTNNTFQELIKTRELNRYQDNLDHDLSKYLLKQQELVNKKTVYENNQIFNVINNAIIGQIAAYDVKNNKVLDKSSEEIKKYIKLILSTEILGKYIFKENQEIQVEVDISTIDSFIYEIVFPQLLLNIKDYANPYSPDIKITISEDSFIFINKKGANLPNENRKGLKMCKQMTEEILGYKFNKNPVFETDYFKVEIKLL